MLLYFIVFSSLSFCKYSCLPYIHSRYLPPLSFSKLCLPRDSWTLAWGCSSAQFILLARRLFLPTSHSPQVYFYSAVILVWGLRADFFLLQRELGPSMQYRFKPAVVQVNMKEHITYYLKTQSNCNLRLYFQSFTHSTSHPLCLLQQQQDEGLKGWGAQGSPQCRSAPWISSPICPQLPKARSFFISLSPEQTHSRRDGWKPAYILRSCTRASQCLLPDKDSLAMSAIFQSTDLVSRIYFGWRAIILISENDHDKLIHNWWFF